MQDRSSQTASAAAALLASAEACAGRPGREKKKMKKGGASAAAPPVMVAAAAVALVVLLLMATAGAHGAVTCAEVDANLRPCVGYATGKEAAPPADCCAGVRRIRAMPSGAAERRQACECVKQAAARFQGLDADAVRDLPAQCGSPLPFPLSLSFDCSTIP